MKPWAAWLSPLPNNLAPKSFLGLLVALAGFLVISVAFESSPWLLRLSFFVKSGGGGIICKSLVAAGVPESITSKAPGS